MNVELLSDYEFQPDLRLIKNQIQAAYYKHDDIELANWVNQLGKALEGKQFKEEVIKCHVLDARISILNKNNEGYVIAISNLVIALSERYLEKYEDFDFGFLLLLNEDLSAFSAKVQELVARKFIISIYYAGKALVFPDTNALLYIVSCDYQRFAAGFSRDALFWETLITQCQLLLKYGFLRESQRILSFLDKNLRTIRSFPDDAFAYYDVLVSVQLIEQNDAVCDTVQKLINYAANCTQKEVLKSQDIVLHVCDELLQFGKYNYVDLVKQLLSQCRSKQQLAAYLQQFEAAKAELLSADLNEQLIGYINYNCLNQPVDIAKLANPINYQVYLLLQTQYSSGFRQEQFFAAAQQLMALFNQLDPRIAFTAFDFLAIICRQVYYYCSFSPQRVLSEIIKLSYHASLVIPLEDEIVEDFIEQMLDCYWRNGGNQSTSAQGGDSPGAAAKLPATPAPSFLARLGIQDEFSLDFCVQQLSKQIGFVYEEKNYAQILRAETSVDQLMIKSGFVKTPRQRQMQIFENSSTAKAIPARQRQKTITKLQEVDKALEGSKQQLLKYVKVRKPEDESAPPTSASVEKKHGKSAASTADTANDSESSTTQSLTDQISERDVSPRPRLLASSNPIKISPNVNVQSSCIDDLDSTMFLTHTDTIVKQKQPVLQPNAQSFSNQQSFAPQSNSPQQNYQQYTQFIRENNLDNLSQEQKLLKYKEFLLVQEITGQVFVGSRSSSLQSPTVQKQTLNAQQPPCESVKQQATNAYQQAKQVECFKNSQLLSLSANSKIITENILQSQCRQIILESTNVDDNICSAIMKQNTLKLLSFSNCRTNSTLLLQVFQKLSQLEELRCQIFDLSAQQALNIILLSNCQTLSFSNLLGLDVLKLQPVNVVSSREIRQVVFGSSNFYGCKPLKVLAGDITINQLTFQNCIYNDVFLKAVQETCEVQIQAIQ